MENGDHLPFRLLLECPSGLSPSQVSIVFDEAYDRIPHPDINLENSISEIWNQRAQKNSSLFNGTKFRYGGHLLPGGSDTDQDQHACLYLGLTDYRTFMGTNLNPQWEKFLFPSEDDCRRCQHTSSPLGNGAVVETLDKKILVLQRSYNVGEFPGHYVFPGGHPEPQEVGIISHQFDEGKKDVKQSNESICKEMFDSIIREVVEEIGVPEASLGNPLLIGISRRVLNVRPAAFFFIKCSLRSDEIQQLYSSAVDAYESTQLYTVSKSELEVMAAKMPGCHQGGFALYKSMLPVSSCEAFEMRGALSRSPHVWYEKVYMLCAEHDENDYARDTWRNQYPLSVAGNPLFIGISRRVLNVRPAAFFFIKCSLRSDEIQQLYSSAVDAYESTQLYTVSKSELEVMAAKMPGCHQGGFALYKSMVNLTSYKAFEML